MSVGVLPASRYFHWESARKPALTRCAYRATSPHHQPAGVTHLHAQYPCPHHHRHHHRPRRRHFTGESPPWPRRSSEAAPPSLASSWHTDSSSLLTTDSLTLSGEEASSSTGRFSLSPTSLYVARNSFVGSRMATGAPRSTSEGPRGTSTAAAREVKQYLNRTLFPRPSSTLQGYASLYHRLKKLPAAHRKALQRSKAAAQQAADADAAAAHPDGQAESDMDDIDSLEGRLPSPPRLEIHIYVPTAAAAAAAAAAHDEDGSAPL
ncbi:uncharacterized protein LOC126998760 [Eriocheir sinensis]|uniref:uncharacterized protein LOC126998760 n=1 Tax=Eriocheir sinensis TaxID=95602 RepID=UPI0021CABD5E|nr:uncharacterized protein LOC126998760 [Eriocheir sinensis]XP_050716739.1 uncharacterized protein LOC126998760 [Eriocheir sinensis]